jgi:type IV pilus assembly protein PilW
MKLFNLKRLTAKNPTIFPLNIGCSKQSGVTLIELMVVLVIGLVVSLAIFGVMSANEGRKRTTTSVNDMDQSANYGLYQMDKLIRSAGTGFTQAYTQTYGCELLAKKNTVAILPPSADLPKPFSAAYANILASIGNTFRLAPIIIVNGTRTNLTAGSNPSDSLIIMSGSAGLGEASIGFRSVPTAPTLNVVNVAGFRATTSPDADILAIVAYRDTTDATVTTMPPCMLEQVSTPFTPVAGAVTVGLGGAFYTASDA